VRLALSTLEDEVHGGSMPGHFIKTAARSPRAALASDALVP